jgi:hypothetical protein
MSVEFGEITPIDKEDASVINTDTYFLIKFTNLDASVANPDIDVDAFIEVRGFDSNAKLLILGDVLEQLSRNF